MKKNDATGKKVVKIYYNEKGIAHPDEASVKGICCARLFKTKSGSDIIEKFYILVDKNGKLYNPQEYSNVGHIRFKEKSVNEACFDMYLDYLQTKREMVYRKALREALR